MQDNPYAYFYETTRPTVRLLVNLANVSPDVHVYLWQGTHNNVIYRGRYDELPGELLRKSVESFSVKTLGTTDYGRKYIDRMDIEIS